ncbi:MAG: extradiol ring-cleavage dioxygenase [Rhodospirillaceae bacterium BRH_c57]|nr:MAG: extradiol ring-cleavage dioxygenase [Rhodospirillaceae bacterium BRH_c57]
MPQLPALFLSHGAPTLATEPSVTADFLAELGGVLPRPTAIVVVSAHWDTARPMATGAARPPTIHDFGGFGPELHAMRYPAAGVPALAVEVAEQLTAAGLPASVDAARGFDHGVWVPLSRMYPKANIPTLAVSLQSGLGPAHHFALGQALQPLRERDVLIVGSGSLTHNLREFFGRAPVEPGETYATEFADWIAAAVARGDVEALLDYRRQAPHAERAHPTDEHLLPLFVALGAGSPGVVGQRIHHAMDAGVLSMDAYRFD